MWKKIKGFFSKRGTGSEGGERPYDLKWHYPGPDNPFGVTFLDCRPYIQTMVSFTSEGGVAESFKDLRASDGRELIGTPIPEAVHIGTKISIPYKGPISEGVLFKADTMETKWDIYLYDSVFLFARSWTGDLFFRAAA